MGERIQIQEYLDMIKRRKWIIIVIVLLSLVLGGFKTYQNYTSYVPTYRSRVVVKIDTMKVQKEEAEKERKEGSNKKKKYKDDDEGTSGSTNNNGSDTNILYNYSAIAQDESIASRYYSYAADSSIYPKVAQIAGVRESSVKSISAIQQEERPEIIEISVVSSNAQSAQLIASAIPKVYGDELLKEIGMDCVVTVYDATKGTVIPRKTDSTIATYGLGGIVIAIFIVLLLELLNTKIITPDDVEKYWELPLLGVVPEFELNSHTKGKKRK